MRDQVKHAGYALWWHIFFQYVLPAAFSYIGTPLVKAYTALPPLAVFIILFVVFFAVVWVTRSVGIPPMMQTGRTYFPATVVIRKPGTTAWIRRLFKKKPRRLRGVAFDLVSDIDAWLTSPEASRGVFIALFYKRISSVCAQLRKHGIAIDFPPTVSELGSVSGIRGIAQKISAAAANIDKDVPYLES